MKVGKFIFFAALILAGFLFSGCELFREALEESIASENPNDDDYETKFNIGIFQVVKYPRAEVLEKEISLPDGDTICVNTNALFSSKRIRQAKAIPRPGNPEVYDLEFRIDRMGKTQWMMLEAERKGNELVMLVDNRCVGTFIPERYTQGSQDWVKVHIGVDMYTARGIVKFAKKNYDFYNPEAKSFFSNF